VGITRSVGSVLVLRSDPCTQIDGHHGSREAVWSPFYYRRRLVARVRRQIKIN
jgi:hypothetical protein